MAAKVKIIRHIDNHLLWIFDIFGHRDSIGFQFMLVSALARLLLGVCGVWQAMPKCGWGQDTKRNTGTSWKEFTRQLIPV